MALPVCFHLAENVFPRVRAAAARELSAAGQSQGRIAQALGISQSMVSRYVASASKEVDPLVLRLSHELILELDSRPRGAGPSAWCGILTRTRADPGADEALADLLAAERMLLEANPLRLAPQIGMNLARALPAAKSADEIVSFPGRIVEAAGRLVSPVAPAFGASGHLAACLLTARAVDPSILAIGSVRGGTEVNRAAGKLGLSPVSISRTGGPRESTEGAFRQAVERAQGDLRAVHDPGAFGIEPCMYLCGPDAGSVASRILELQKALSSKVRA